MIYFKVKLYNIYSAESLYDVDIDFTNDENFNINFNPNAIKNLLENIDINKAQGPERNIEQK